MRVHQQTSSSHSSHQKWCSDAIRHTGDLETSPLLIESLKLLQPSGTQLRLVDELLFHLLQSFVRVSRLGLAPGLLTFALPVLHFASVVGGDLVHDKGVQGRAQRFQ
jgi:hypothetical protein